MGQVCELFALSMVNTEQYKKLIREEADAKQIGMYGGYKHLLRKIEGTNLQDPHHLGVVVLWVQASSKRIDINRTDIAIFQKHILEH